MLEVLSPSPELREHIAEIEYQELLKQLKIYADKNQQRIAPEPKSWDKIYAAQEKRVL